MKSFGEFLNEGSRGFFDIDLWLQYIPETMQEVMDDSMLTSTEKLILMGLVDEIEMAVKARQVSHDDMSVGEFATMVLKKIMETEVRKQNPGEGALGTFMKKFLDKIKEKLIGS